MKLFKYLAYAIAAAAIFSACDTEDTKFTSIEKVDSNMAKIQITRVVPEGDYSAAATDNRFYRLVIDGEDMWGDDYILWARMGTVPSTGGYYLVTPGTHTIQCYYKRSGEYLLAYDSQFTVETGQCCNLFIYDYAKPPVIVDNSEPREYFVYGGTQDVTWTDDPNDPYNAARFQSLRFVNLMFEKEGQPCDYKLQYYYQNPYDLEWYPVGDPVAFGEYTEWTKIYINIFAPARTGQSGTGSSRNDTENRTDKTLSTGTCIIYYRAKKISASGADEGWITYTFKGEGGEETVYDDYWTATTGVRYFHVMRGCRISSTNGSYEGMFVTSIAKY